MKTISKKEIRIAAFCTIFFLSFFCKGAAIMPLVHASVPAHAAMEHEEHGSCCSEQASAAINDHHDTVFALPDVVDVFVSLAGASFFVLAYFVSRTLARVLMYIKSIRLRFGAPSVFDFFTALFRLGILHPKRW